MSHSITERVLDRLADILFASDEILDMIRVEENPQDGGTFLQTSVQRVYDEVNELMKTHPRPLPSSSHRFFRETGTLSWHR